MVLVLFLQYSFGQTVYGLSERVMVSFKADKPNHILSQVSLDTLGGGKLISGFDIRPATGQFYVLGYNPTNGATRIYTLDSITGKFSTIGTEDFFINPGIKELTLDFNPTVDRIRLLGSDGSNLRLHPQTGILVATDGMLAFNVGDVNEGETPVIGAGAYTNSFPGTTTTTLYDYDISKNILLSQIPPNDGKLNTIGSSGIMLDPDRPVIDMDIFYSYKDSSNTAYAVSSLMGVSCNQFYKIDIKTGMASLIGTVGGTEDIFKIAVMLDEPLPPSIGYKAQLTGRNQVFPIATLATGDVMATLTGNILTVSGTYTNLSDSVNLAIAGGAHIHRGLAGQNGPVEFILKLTQGTDANSGVFKPEDNVFELTESQIATLKNREYYVNIHTKTYHSGELRGQLVPEEATLFVANVFGSNQVPAIVSEGYGAVIAELTGDTLVISGSFAQLEGEFAANIAGGAHIHFGVAGENGGIALHLNSNVSEDLKSGKFEAQNNKIALNAEAKAALMASGLYVNIHTSVYNSGELRGQLTPQNQIVMRASLSGYNEYPYVTSLGKGLVIAEISGTELRVSGTFSGLNSPLNPNIAGGVHLHVGLAGRNGGILTGLKPTLSADGLSGKFIASENTFSLTSEQLLNILNREVYINIHTEENHSGELRGQLLNESQYFMNALLTGSQQVPQFITPGHGAVTFEISGNHAVLSGSFSEMDGAFNAAIAGGAHIHMGQPGQNGGILTHLHTVTSEDLKSGSFPASMNRIMMDANQKNAIKNRMAYVNIHTTLSPSGELRGNIGGEASIYAYALLGGTSEGTPVHTDGKGVVAFEITEDRIISSGSFTLDSDFNAAIAGGAHIHIGMAGQNGGITLHLQASPSMDLKSGTFVASENTKAITTEFLTNFMLRNLYVNIHTSAFPSGEIRGQVLPLANSFFHANLSGLNEVPAIMSNGFGSVKAELTADQLIISGSFSNLDGEFDPNIAGGAHVHMAENGMNGGIAFHLDTDLDMANKSGKFLAAKNIKTLTSEQINSLKSAALYVNIHTTKVASGEIRGQLLKEINFAPSSSFPTSPANEIVVDIKDLGMDTITVAWTAATDVNGDKVSYLWQASLTPDFADTLVSVDTRRDTMFTIAVQDFLSLLDSTTFEMKDTAMIFHRVISKDGSDYKVGETAVLTLTNSLVSSIFDIDMGGLDLLIYPTIAVGDVINARIEAESPANGQLLIINQSGQVINKFSVEAQQGQTEIQIPVGGLSSGMYYSLFMSGNQKTRLREFIRQ
jgi:hypothetical protein